MAKKGVCRMSLYNREHQLWKGGTAVQISLQAFLKKKIPVVSIRVFRGLGERLMAMAGNRQI